MNNKIIWLAGLVVVVGVGAYLMMAQSKTGKAPTNNDYMNNEVKDNKNSSEPVSKTSSLKDLLAMGTSQKCTYNSEGSEGVVYVGSGKTRVDFSATDSGATTKGHMIADGKVSYVWMNNEKQGFKVSLEAAEQAQANAPATPNKPAQGVDYDKDMNFKCEKWTLDSAMFAMPSGVEFMDMSTMMDPSKMMDGQKMMEDAMKKAGQ